MTNITNTEEGGQGRFKIEHQGKSAGLMEYTRTGDKITITHTEVGEKYGGQGLGGQLVDAAADYARTNNLKIYPACSFARHVLEKDDSYKDVLAQQ